MLIRFNWLHNVNPRENYNLSLTTAAVNCCLPMKTQTEIANVKCQTIERERLKWNIANTNLQNSKSSKQFFVPFPFPLSYQKIPQAFKRHPDAFLLIRAAFPFGPIIVQAMSEYTRKGIEMFDICAASDSVCV